MKVTNDVPNSNNNMTTGNLIESLVADDKSVHKTIKRTIKAIVHIVCNVAR